MAIVSGFQNPILHGLCSLGIAARAVLQEYGDNEADNLLKIKCRFASTVEPGQTLVIRMWKQPNNRIICTASVKETGKLVMSNFYVDLKGTGEAKL